MARSLALLFLLALPAFAAHAQSLDAPPQTVPNTFYRRSSLGAEYLRRDYVEGDRGTGFTVLFTAEPFVYTTPFDGDLTFGGLVGGGIGVGGVRRQLPTEAEPRAFVVNRYEATGLLGLDVPLGDALRGGLFAGYSAQGLVSTFERAAPLMRLRLNTLPVRFEGNALLTGQREGSLHLIVPMPTGNLIRGTVAFGFHATRYETARSGVASLFGFSINATDF